MAKKKSKKKNKPFEIRVTKKMAKKAIKLVCDSFVADGMESGLFNRKHLHVIVSLADGTKICTHSIGKKKKWENAYNSVAKVKFGDTVRTQMPSRRVQSESPHMASGEYPYYGSWIDNGLIVAASGVQAYWDEVICKMIIATILGLIYEQQAKLLAKAARKK